MKQLDLRLEAARLELQECESSRSELQGRLTVAMEKGKQERIQAQEQSVQALEERLNEARLDMHVGKKLVRKASSRECICIRS